MTRQHFEELCEQTYLDGLYPPKDRNPYNVLLLMVWAFELELDDIDCIVDTMRHSGKAIATGTSDEFEGVELRPNGGPQMWHTETPLLDHQMIGSFIYVGGADEDSKNIFRESTHFIKCEHARYRDLDSDDKKKKRRAYLESIWDNIKREPTQKGGGKNGKITISFEFQGEFKETLTNGLEYIVFESTGTSATYFCTGLVHRGPQTKVHGFGIFQAWKGRSENISSDGLPVSIDNYKG